MFPIILYIFICLFVSVSCNDALSCWQMYSADGRLMNTIMERWWSDNCQRKTELLGNKPVPMMDCPGTVSGPPPKEADLISYLILL